MVHDAIERQTIRLLRRAVHTQRASRARHSHQHACHIHVLVASGVRRREAQSRRVPHIAREVAPEPERRGVRVAPVKAVRVDLLHVVALRAVKQETLVQRQLIDAPMVIRV